MSNLKPIVKWSGGKKDEIKKFIEHIPTNFNTYLEPFIGGGAVYFHLNPEKAVINDVHKDMVTNIKVLDMIASSFAIGRDIHVGDTIVGIKGRVGFEAAAALIIIKAHHLLEKHTLTKWQLQHKDYLANWYGTHLHEGLFLDPVMRDLEAFLESSQKQVSGDVIVSLKPYHFTLDGINSKNDLMKSDFGSYGEENRSWTADEAKGFIKIYGNQIKLYNKAIS